MFKSLASAVMAGRVQAVTLALTFAVLAVFLPPFSLLSGAVVALVALRVGPRAGIEVALLVTLVLVVLGLALGAPMAGLSSGLSQWLPVILLAALLRATGSWPATALAAVAVAIAVVWGFHLMVPDLAGWWEETLQRALQPLLQQDDAQARALREALPKLSRMMTGIVALSAVLNALLALMLGRWWQALLYNPGGFGEEFRAWRLPGWLGVLAMAGFMAGVWLGLDGLTESGMLLLLPFFFQGLAVVHAMNRALGWPGVVLFGLYLLLVLALPQMVAMLTAIGVIDGLADFRRRLPQQAGGGGRKP